MMNKTRNYMDFSFDERREYEKLHIKKYDEKYARKVTHNDDLELKRYINIHTSYRSCNLRCDYCYVWRTGEFEQKELTYPSMDFFKRALSKERWGGLCFINFCAEGETLADYQLFPLIKAVIEEGHFIQVVTNGTAAEAYELLNQYSIDFSHILFKFSFHYKQLRDRGLLEVYFNNILRMREAGASITLELVPSDNIVEYIDEIKEISLSKVGALPQLTVPREVNDSMLPIMTKYSQEEFTKIWSVFDSVMFDIKMKHFNVKRVENCHAGRKSFWMDLATGELYKCCKFGYLGNVYENISDPILYDEIGSACEVPYCYNGHIYFPFGVVDDVHTVTYDLTRDRTLPDGTHWITDKMRSVISQRIH
ncbi:radical SAM protein [Butyrivibrio sp. FC2001]|uniref:radical SAM protein n=1 Tax=Butyrivibrio sp. FC2001 TaxID=1280671 RepID=UPI000417F174|nr:radical SAM protein [Butyrivibrio sp. FC2001]